MGDPSTSTVLAAPGTEAKVVVKDAYSYKKSVFDKGYPEIAPKATSTTWSLVSSLQVAKEKKP
jgi:hypothetical protein